MTVRRRITAVAISLETLITSLGQVVMLRLNPELHLTHLTYRNGRKANASDSLSMENVVLRNVLSLIISVPSRPMSEFNISLGGNPVRPLRKAKVMAKVRKEKAKEKARKEMEKARKETVKERKERKAILKARKVRAKARKERKAKVMAKVIGKTEAAPGGQIIGNKAAGNRIIGLHVIVLRVLVLKLAAHPVAKLTKTYVGSGWPVTVPVTLLVKNVNGSAPRDAHGIRIALWVTNAISSIPKGMLKLR